MMFSILIGRLDRPRRNEEEEKWWREDRKELLEILAFPGTLLNDGEKDILSRFLSPTIG
jgi:hypothetical protein